MAKSKISKSVKKYYVLKIIYFISLVFIIGGAVNYGMSRFLLATPFVILAALVARKAFQDQHIFIATLVFSVLAVCFNSTLERNKYIFPILEDGYVTVKENGYYYAADDGSAGFTDEKLNYLNCEGCPKATYIPIKKGETYKVKKLEYIVSEATHGMAVVTDLGKIHIQEYEQGYAYPPAFELSKPLTIPYVDELGYLMLYPLFLFFLIPISIGSVIW